MAFTQEQKVAYAKKKQAEEFNSKVSKIMEKFDLAKKIKDEAMLELCQMRRKIDLELNKYKKKQIDFDDEWWRNEFDTEEDHDWAVKHRLKQFYKEHPEWIIEE